MPFKSFDEWFAIRPNHQDKNFWPGRLKFDPEKGIELLAVKALKIGAEKQLGSLEKGTITGYLDYQCPATIIKPFIQSYGGLTLSSDTPLLRTSLRIIANGILKNVHITDINEECFTELRIILPALQAWIDPKQVSYSDNINYITGKKVVKINEDYKREFELNQKYCAIIETYTIIKRDEHNFPVKQITSLQLKFPKPMNYEYASKIIWRLNVLFNFMIGDILKIGRPFLETTYKTIWNGEEKTIIAELYFKPIYHNVMSISDGYNRLSVEENSPVNLEELLNHCIALSDSVFYLMELIITIEVKKNTKISKFTEILSALEAFDETEFGSGSDSKFRSEIKSLNTLIKKYGNEEQKAAFKRHSSGFRNSYSLLERLERLARFWKDDGFRGYPDFSKIKKIRNDISHGRSSSLEITDYHYMAQYSIYLSALARYHVLRKLGFSSNAIAMTFMQRPHMFGAYVPLAVLGEQNL